MAHYDVAFVAANYDIKVACRHSSVDSSVPSILPPRVRVPSTPSMLFFNLYLSFELECEKNEKNKQKEAEIGPFF